MQIKLGLCVGKNVYTGEVVLSLGNSGGDDFWVLLLNECTNLACERYKDHLDKVQLGRGEILNAVMLLYILFLARDFSL